MKILIVNFMDSGGGASLGAMRLLTALREHGVDAWMGVYEKQTKNPYVIVMKRHDISHKEMLKRDMFYKAIVSKFRDANPIAHSYNLFSLMDVDTINAFGADVVNLHWVGGGYAFGTRYSEDKSTDSLDNARFMAGLRRGASS